MLLNEVHNHFSKNGGTYLVRRGGYRLSCASSSAVRAHAVNNSVLATIKQQNPGKNFFDVLLPLIEKRRSEL